MHYIILYICLFYINAYIILYKQCSKTISSTFDKRDVVYKIPFKQNKYNKYIVTSNVIKVYD